MRRRAIDKLREFHRSRLLPKYGVPLGASEAEVSNLETQFSGRLPRDYREFLLWMGRDEHGVLRGSDCFVQHVSSNTKQLPELLAENGLADRAPKSCVCAFMHQGYIASWFDLPADSDDPKAFVFNEAQSDLGIQEPGTFIDCFLQDIRGLSDLAT